MLKKLIDNSEFDETEVGNENSNANSNSHKDNVNSATRRRRGALAKVVSSSLYQIPIPDKLESRTYGALFRHLASQGIIPLGLFRGVFPQMKVGSKNNSMPYIYTNPSKDTELFTCDKVFVLSPHSIGKVSVKVHFIHYDTKWKT